MLEVRTLLSAAPIGASHTVSILENTRYQFHVYDFGFSDPNDTPPNHFTAVQITSLPSLGSLTDGGLPVTAGQFVSVADISAGKLTFTPVANTTDLTDYANFLFKVQDDGVGANLDTTWRTMTFDVTAPVSPYVVSINGSGGLTTSGGTLDYTVTFSKAVIGVDASDFKVATTGLTEVTGPTPIVVTRVNASVYTVSVSNVEGMGTLELNLVDNGTIHDFQGDPLTTKYAAPSYRSQLVFQTGQDPYQVVAADLNHDGITDLVTVNHNDNTVSVLLGEGNGFFQPQKTYATGGAPWAVSVADVNGDGIPDIITTNSADNTVSVLLGVGNGTFNAATTFTVGDNPQGAPVIADVNRDGRPDIITTNAGDNTVSVLLGNGNGTFQNQVTYAVGSYPRQVVVADVNNDGNADLVVANANGMSVSVLLGNGNGTFQNQVQYAAGSSTGNTKFLSVADLNHDGNPDIVVTDGNADTVSVLLNNGNGTFQSQVTYATGETPQAVQVADVNGDGIPDLIVSNWGSNSDNVGVLLGKGNGTFQSQVTFATLNAPHSIAIADLNGDGRPDLIVANEYSHSVSVLLSSANGSFSGQTYTVTAPTFPHVVSINGSNAGGLTTAGGTVTYTVTFSEPVTGVDAVDFKVATTGLTKVTGPIVVTPASNSVYVSVYTVSISIQGAGTAELNLIDNGTIRNAQGNPLASSNGSVTYKSQLVFQTGQDPYEVVVADLNHDGIPDLITANQADSTVSVLLGIGNGFFLAQKVYATGGTPWSVSVADVNGDGIPDIITTNSADNTISVLLGVGNGTFKSARTFAVGADPQSAPVIADVNGDGKPDIITTNAGDGTVSVLLGNGDGTFKNQIKFAVGSYPRQVAVADVNNDGIPDLVVANADGMSVSVLLGNGNGTFQNQVQYAAGSSTGNTKFLSVADLNHDGNPDIVVTDGNADTVSVLLNNGNGTFQNQVTYATGETPQAVQVADVNGDGIPDLIVSNWGSDSDNVGVLLGNGNGTFQNQVTFATLAAPHSIAIADLNGDGRPDMVVANEYSHSVSVLMSSMSGSFSGQTYAITAPTFPQVVSINGSGGLTTSAGTVTYTVTFSEPVAGVDASDFKVATTGSTIVTGSIVVTPVSNSAYVSVYTVSISGIQGMGTAELNLVDNGTIRNAQGNPLASSNGSVTYKSQLVFQTGQGPFEVVVADVNHDGIPDLITANQAASTVSVLLGIGNGFFQSQKTYPTGGTPWSVSVADVNGDGIPDIITSNSADNTVSVLLGNGNGTFKTASTFAVGTGPESAPVIADVNGDGKPDIITTNTGDSTVSVLLGNGDGTFQKQVTYAVGSDPRQVAVADVNNDGIPDLIVANAYGMSVSVLLGNGDGTFQNQVQYAAGSSTGNTKFLSVADLNHDGKPDIVVTDGNADTVSVLLNNGNGTFQSQVTYATGETPQAVQVADLNGDGIPDLIVSNWGSDSDNVGVLLGNGNGTFQDQVTFATLSAPHSIAVADLNGDGRPDLVVANEYSHSVSVLLSSMNGSFNGQTYTVTS